LTQSEVKQVEKSLIDTGWEVTAIHNHELEESPQMIFLHAQKIDNLDNITQDIRDILSSDTDWGCT
jgi:predicted small metal-binding protein